MGEKEARGYIMHLYLFVYIPVGSGIAWDGVVIGVDRIVLEIL